jgi:cellobiose phosphorylase
MSLETANVPCPRPPSRAPDRTAGTYRFDDDNGAIDILRPDLPAPWINYLSNGTLHAFVSQAAGGFCWWKSPVNGRLTRYRMHHLPIDSPGFYLYLRRSDGSTWSPAFRPCEVLPERWNARHQPGLTSFHAEHEGLEATLTLFIAPHNDTLIWDLELRNLTDEEIPVDVFAYVELSQMLWQREQFHGYYWRHMLNVWWDPKLQALIYLDHNQFHPRIGEVPLVYFASDAPVSSFSGSRDAFIGHYRTERNPLAIEQGCCDNEELSTGEPCGALHRKLTLSPQKTTRLKFYLGTTEGALSGFDEAKERAATQLEKLRRPGATARELTALKDWWGEYLGHFHCELPDTDAQRQINLWGPVNCVQTARYSRSVNANAPGIRGIGFRDSCQDMLAMVSRKPAWARDMFLKLLSKQYEDGHTVHMIPLDEHAMPGINTHSDNHLWLPFLAYALLAETGERKLFEQEVPWLAEDHINAGAQAAVWEHLLAAIRFTQTHRGAHGLPLTLAGDWNDIIGRFSRRGLGESVFAGQQYVLALRYMIDMAHHLGDDTSLPWLNDCLRDQQEAIRLHGWDGQWWRRGFDDDGAPIGSEACTYGKLFLNPQSWSVLSDTGTPEQQAAAMRAVYEQLNTPMGVKKLTPGFPTWPKENDPFTGYGPGCGENGAVFCHAHAWAVIAEARLGNAERAWNYYRELLPHLALQRAGLDRYQGEPYAWASNIVGPENANAGWANVTHISGTAAWMDVAATQYLLGIRPELDGLRLTPCVPMSWNTFNISRNTRGCKMNIRFDLSSDSANAPMYITIDGNQLPSTIGNIVPYESIEGKSSVSIVLTR